MKREPRKPSKKKLVELAAGLHEVVRSFERFCRTVERDNKMPKGTLLRD